MGFKVKFDKEAAVKAEKENSFGVLPKGEYEAFITKVDPNLVTKGKGTKGINLTFTIRDDVDQEGQKRKIFDTIYYENADGSENGGIVRLQPFLDKLGIPTGMEVDVDNIEEIAYGKPIRIELDIDEYNGKEKNVVAFMGYKAATVGGRYSAPADSNPTLDDPFAGNEGSIDISDDDLPF